LFFGSLPPLLLVLVLLVMGCSTVDADECFPNTSGGFGGSGTMPIGAGVGATTGGDRLEPPREPLDNGEAPYNPCVKSEAPEKQPPKSTCEMPTPAAEGATYWICSEECSSKCAPHVRITYVTFSPSEFPFVTIVKDDGTGDAGGWQEAKANLEFINAIVPRSVRKWYCDFIIGMPLRPEMMEKISAKRAADLSVEITEDVAKGMNYDLPSVPFCADFMIKARAAFKSKYPYLGARVDK
ncbi:MAG: hypothetical protein ABI134_33040, partial [Byssovorax sp.]